MVDQLLMEWDLFQFMLIVLTLAVCNVGLAMFVRALPWPRSWIDRKPLACPVCMNGWAAFVTLIAAKNEMIVDWPFVRVAFAWCALIAIGAPIFAYVYPAPLAFPEES